MNPRVFRIIALACLATLFWQSACPAVIPDADNPDAYTEKDYRRQLLEYNKQTLTGAYLEVGKRDSRWDALVVELMDAQAGWFTNFEVEEMDQVRVDMDTDRYWEVVGTLRELGCDDPLVKYLLMRSMGEDEPGYIAAATDAERSLAESDYPALRKLGAANWLYQRIDSERHPEECERLTGRMEDLLYQMITEEPLDAIGQRHVLTMIDDTLEQVPRIVWHSVAQRADVSDSPNRWLIDMVNGLYHHKIAWDARGGGWAYKVTDEGWKGFEHHQGLARHYITRAWQNEKTLPEAPSNMISVAMADGSGEERVWFERSVDAQFDYAPSYRRYVWALRPRWGGSFTEMYAFGLECLETGRHDTDITSYYYRTLQDIADDSGDYRYWQRPGVYEKLVAYFDTRKDTPNSSDAPSWWDSQKAAIAWRIGRYEEAAGWIDRLGEDFYPRTFTFYEGDEVISLSEVRARTGPHADAVTQAGDAWQLSRFDEACRILEQTLADTAEGDPAIPYLQKQAARADWLHGMSTGEWVDLLDRTDLGGWEVDRGEWSVDDKGRITGISTGDGAYLKCRVNFGYRFEIRGTLTLPRDDQPPWYNGGVLLAHYMQNNYAYPQAILIFPRLNKVAYMRYISYDKAFYPVDLDMTSRFHIQMWDEHVRMYVNDELIIGHRIMPADLDGEVLPFAIGSGTPTEGVEVRFDALEARPLREVPDWISDEETPFVTTGDG